MDAFLTSAKHVLRPLAAFALTFGWVVLQRFWSPPFVFVIYGNSKLRGATYPEWLLALGRLLGLLPITGFIRCGDQVGLVVGLLETIDEIEADPCLVAGLHDRLMRNFPRSSVALAGRLPALMHKAGLVIKPPFVGGFTGTCFAMRRIALALAQQYIRETQDKASESGTESTHSGCDSDDGRDGMGPCEVKDFDSILINSNILSVMSDSNSARRAAASLTVAVIGGGGFVGSRLVEDLSRFFSKVVAFDPRFTEPAQCGNVLRTSNPESLGEAQVSLIFTPCGDDVAPLVSFLSADSIVADDTHPCVAAGVQAKFQAADVTLLKAAAVNETHPVCFYPKLPNFYHNSIPGCLLEALVVARLDHTVSENFERFCQQAEALGFGPQLMSDATIFDKCGEPTTNQGRMTEYR